MTKNFFLHDMIHNNPGQKQYSSEYAKPSFLKERCYDGKVFDLFDCAQFGLYWDKLELSEKVFEEGSPARDWVTTRRKQLHEDYKKAKEEGLKVYFMMDMIVLPKRLIELYPQVLDSNGNIDIMKNETKVILDMMFTEMFEVFPEIDGIYIRYGETYVGDEFLTPYHTGNNPILDNGSVYHIYLINYLIRKVCKEYNKKIMYRTWGFGSFQYDPEVYQKISSQIPLDSNFYFCIKHTEGDFHRTYRFNQCLNAGEHQQVIEIQAAREYEGKGAYPDYISEGVINGFEEYDWLMKKGEKLNLKDVMCCDDTVIKGVWTWSRGGGWDGPFINGDDVKQGSELWCDLNAYVIAQWTKNQEHSDEFYVKQYAEKILGMKLEDCNKFYKLCKLSAHAVLMGRATNQSVFPFDVFWTRDQNIDYKRIIANILSAQKKDALRLLLAEKEESVNTWKEIVEISDSFDDSVEMKKFIQVSSRYGYYLYYLYYLIYDINVLAYTGAEEKTIENAIAAYDEIWDKWIKLYKENPECPTLFEKSEKRLDLIGYDWNTGLDGAVEPVRDKAARETNLKKVEEQAKNCNVWGL